MDCIAGYEYSFQYSGVVDSADFFCPLRVLRPEGIILETGQTTYDKSLG